MGWGGGGLAQAEARRRQHGHRTACMRNNPTYRLFVSDPVPLALWPDAAREMRGAMRARGRKKSAQKKTKALPRKRFDDQDTH